MNSPATPQVIGNLCAGIAAVLFLVPIQKLLHTYSDKHVNDNDWMTPALYSLVPMWLLLVSAMICVTASGGFNWLRLGRASQYALTAAGTVSLGLLMFAALGAYVRPGFTPRIIYTPVIYLVPLSSILLVVLSINPRFTAAFPIQWLRVPWTILAGLCLGLGVLIGTPYLVRNGRRGIAGIIHHIQDPGPTSQETLARVSGLDPETQFEDLLFQATHRSSRDVFNAATARLRSHPKFLERLASELESGYVEPALGFLADASLSPAEQARLAKPARRAMARWVDQIPAPNYTTRDHLRKMKRWGSELLPPVAAKFPDAGVDFADVLEEFQEKVSSGR